MMTDEDYVNKTGAITLMSEGSICLHTIYSRDIFQRIFFMGLLGHCFVRGWKGHMVTECTRKVSSLGEATKQVRDTSST